MAREREERNYYQLEKDRVQTFWEVASKQLDECRAEARVKDRELEEAEERHQMEVKVYKQKVKHLLYEKENHLADLKAENMVGYVSGLIYQIFGYSCQKTLTIQFMIFYFSGILLCSIPSLYRHRLIQSRQQT